MKHSTTPADTDTTMSSDTDSDTSKMATEKKEESQNKSTETTRPGLTSRLSAFFPIFQPQAPARPSKPGESPKPEACVLQEILAKKEKELEKLREENESNRTSFVSSSEQLQRAREHIASLKHHYSREVGHLQDTLAKYKSNAVTSAKLIEKLENEAKEKQAQLSKAYSSAVSTWVQDVSRDMPDDVIRSTISSFFQGDFFSWCADMCASEIDWSKGFKHNLNCFNLVNQSPHYRSGPAHLLFDYEAPHGTSSLVLLQAALAKSLVNNFLRNPYFLLDDGTVLQNVERTLAESKFVCSC